MIRDYQIAGKDFIVAHNGRAILADEAGTGKTLQTILAVNELKQFPVLCISTKPGLYVWKNEIKQWLGEESFVYSGTPANRSESLKHNSKFLITNYAFVPELLKIFGNHYFKTVVTDEFHLPGVLNHKTHIYKDVKRLCNLAPCVIMPTGTPMRKTPADLFAPLSILDPVRFPNYWDFVREFCITIKTGYGFEIEPMPKDVELFRDMLSHYLIRRLKEQVLKELPEKTRQAIPVFMETTQRKLYDQLIKDMYFEYGTTLVATPNALARTMRVRQLLATPQIFGIPIIGGALCMLHDIAMEEISLSRPIAVFTPFTDAIPYIKLILEGLYKDNIWVLQGGMQANKIQEVVDGFQSCKGTVKAIICSIKSGVSQTITDAKTAIFLGYEWGPYDNTQAEDRLHRHGQHDNVRCLYLLHQDCPPEQHMIDILNSKQQAISFVLSPKEFYEELVK